MLFRSRDEAGCDEGFADPLTLGELGGEVVAGVAERCRGDTSRRCGDRRGSSTGVEQRGGCWSGDGVADAERGVTERLRHRAQHDQVRALVEPGDDGLAAVLDVGLVDDDRGLGVAPRELDELGRGGNDARRVVGVAAPDEARAVGTVRTFRSVCTVRARDGIAAGQQRRDAL